MKTGISNKVISNYGGALPVYNLIERFGIRKMITESLGERPVQSKYQYDDVIINWLMTVYCNGYRLIRTEDSKENLALIPGLAIISHDTIGRVLKQLAIENSQIEYQKRVDPSHPSKSYTINENDKLNELLLRVTKSMGLLKEGVKYILDVDATLIPSDTYEAKPMRKRGRGYSPMVCMINKLPVYISMRSGNASAALKQRECIEKCLAFLEKYGITIDCVRLDGDGYSIETTNYLHSRGVKFIIGADNEDRTFDMVMENPQWKKQVVETFNHVWDDAELHSVPFHFSKQKNVYRLVAVRVGKDNRAAKKSTKWRLEGEYYYKYILTNDETAKELDILTLYHDRGASERNFAYLKNDFGWEILPFSKLNQNTVYLIMAALANNVYQAVLEIISKKVDIIKQTFTLSTFLRKFLKASFSMKNGKATYYRPKIDYPSLL